MFLEYGCDNMVPLKINEKQIRRIYEIIQDTSDYVKVLTDNMTWQLSLPDYQRIKLEEAYDIYQSKLLGVSLDELKHLQFIRNTYRDLLFFYNGNRKMVEEFNPYDENLSLDEACQRYCSCDKESSERIYELISRINRKADYHVKDLREKYNDDLIDKIDIDRDRYVEKILKEDELLKKELDEMFNEKNDSNRENNFGAKGFFL